MTAGESKVLDYLDDPSVGALLGGAYPFRIPVYQRGYAWERKDILDYVNDLRAQVALDDPGAYFFGAIIAVETPLSRAPNDFVFEVVDGQQRLTTFFLTLAEDCASPQTCRC